MRLHDLSNGNLIFVRVRKARRVGDTREEMEREFCEPFMRLRSFPSSGLVTRKLDLYPVRDLEVFPN